MNQRFCCALLLASLFVLSCPGLLGAAPAPATAFFTQSAKRVDCYDYLEFTLKIAHPPAGNPFTEVEVRGEFSRANGAPLKVDGFCDSADGSIFRLRFMPTQAGRYDYVLTYRRSGKRPARARQLSGRTLQSTHGRVLETPGCHRRRGLDLAGRAGYGALGVLAGNQTLNQPE